MDVLAIEANRLRKTYGKFEAVVGVDFLLGLVALAGAALGALATMIVARFAPISAFASLLGLAFYVIMRLWDVLLRGNGSQKAPNSTTEVTNHPRPFSLREKGRG